MRAIDHWSLKRAPDGDGGARSFLLRDGTETGVVVPGCLLEAQFSTPDGTLLFVTHDIPFEERLDIVLLTASGVIADQASLWGAYTTGNFRDISSDGPDSVEFDFFGGHRWRVHRPFGWTRKFVIESVP
jgi:hypothetical protein